MRRLPHVDRWPRRSIRCAAWPAALACVALPAQRDEKAPVPEVDPYTRNEPEALARAGYVSFGPFAFGDGHSSADVDKLLASRDVLWVETAHFRLGVELPQCALPEDRDDRERLQKELVALKKKLPKVNPRTRELDPWLRLHLYAHRCEELYADFMQRLRVTDASFPARGVTPPRYMGEGPYLGQRDKFLVLILTKRSELARYFERFCSLQVEDAMRYTFLGRGCLMFGTCIEGANGAADMEDVALHCHVVWSLVHNLVDGFKSFWYQMPIWWTEGLAHWYLRRIDPEHNNFSGLKDDSPHVRLEFEWARKVRARVGHESFQPFAELMVRTEHEDLEFADHLMMWSRVDFLLSLGDEGVARFMDHMKFAVTERTPTPAELLQRQREALELAWGFGSPAELDEAWKKFVLAKYPTK